MKYYPNLASSHELNMMNRLPRQYFPPMFDFGIEAVTRFDGIAYYGCIWLVEFRDWTRVLAVEDTHENQEIHLVEESDEND